MIFSYHKAIITFKDTIKKVSVINADGKAVTTEAFIQPDYLQYFSCAETLQLQELSRLHLSRMRNYISQCYPNNKSIAITMVEDNTTHMLLPDEYNAKFIICPQNNVQKLLINVESLLTPNEIAFIIHIFSSMKGFILFKCNPRKESSHSYLQLHRLQGLAYWHIAFPPIVSPIETRTMKHLRHLHLITVVLQKAAISSFQVNLNMLIALNPPMLSSKFSEY